MEAAGTHHASIEVWIEVDALPAAVDGDFGFKELAGFLVLVDQAPTSYAALGACGEVAAGLGQGDGFDVAVECGLCCQLGGAKLLEKAVSSWRTLHPQRQGRCRGAYSTASTGEVLRRWHETQALPMLPSWVPPNPAPMAEEGDGLQEKPTA